MNIVGTITHFTKGRGRYYKVKMVTFTIEKWMELQSYKRGNKLNMPLSLVYGKFRGGT
jgi:hypothetical protein